MPNPLPTILTLFCSALIIAVIMTLFTVHGHPGIAIVFLALGLVINIPIVQYRVRKDRAAQKDYIEKIYRGEK